MLSTWLTKVHMAIMAIVIVIVGFTVGAEVAQLAHIHVKK